MKKRTTGALAVLFALLIALLPAHVFAADATTVTIFHTNDMHANLIASTEDGEPNLAVVKAIVDEVPGALLVDAGDATQGQPYCLLSEGYDIIRLMNAAGYDAMCVGNHEFDYGEQAMVKNFAAAEFPVLAANLSFTAEAAEGLDDAIDDYAIYTVNGKNIAIIGMAGLDTMSTVAPADRAGISFGDYVEAVERVLAELDAWSAENGKTIDLTVCLGHMGYVQSADDMDYWSNDLAARVDGIDIIIDGHTHSYMLGNDSVTVGDTLIVSAGGYLSALGRLDITFDESGIASILTTDAMPEAIDASTAQDAATLSLIEEVRASEDALNEVIIGKADEDLHIEGVRNLVADALYWQMQQDIKDDDAILLSYICMGNVRSEIAAGDITMGDAFAVLPWGNPMEYIEITPKTLYAMVENGLRGTTLMPDTGELDDESHCGAFMIGGGFRYVADLTREPTVVDDEAEAQISEGSRIVSITLDDGTVLDRNDDATRIIICSCGYNMGGGDGFWCLVDNYKALSTGISQEEALAQYIKHLSADGGLTDAKLADERYVLSTVPVAADEPQPEQEKPADTRLAAYLLIAVLAAAAIAAVIVLAKKRKNAEEK